MASDRCELLCLDLEVAERLRSRRLGASHAERAAGRARALADPTRLMLACALREAEELCVCDLAWIAERSQNLASHHCASSEARASCTRAGPERWSCTRSARKAHDSSTPCSQRRRRSSDERA